LNLVIAGQVNVWLKENRVKTVGLIGGMSWESTLSYYKGLNEGVKEALGGLHSAKINLHSVNFAEIEKLQREGRWQETAEILSSAAKGLEAAGSDFFMICTNTMHKVAGEVVDSVSMPILHIADATAKQLKIDNVSKVGLLGTAFTMEQEFYQSRLIDLHNIDVVIPEDEDRALVHRVIYDELCLGRISADSRREYVRIVASLAKNGAQAVILGCTEIALLIGQDDTEVPLYDTTAIHVDEAVRVALGKSSL